MSLSSAATIAMATVHAIVADALGGSPAWAGVPSATLLIGSAAAAPLWGGANARLGRRRGLTLGLAVGAAGAVLAGMGFLLSSLAGFLFGLALVGVASAAVQLSRFAAGEVHPPALRAQAISTVVLGGAVGSIVGPVIVGPSGGAAIGVGFGELAGPYGAGFLLMAAGSALVALLLRPDPQDLGREVAAIYQPEVVGPAPARTVGAILRTREATLAVVAMVAGQAVMVMVMVMTSLHMRGHDHALSSISLVMASHTFGMFAFSIISGRLADRFGRTPVIAAGAATLILACLAATLSPQVLPLAVSLFLLGLGWNFCYVGGSSLLADQLRPSERARTQGFNDLLIGGASAVASLSSGIVFAAVGFATMAVVGAVLALLPLGLALGWRKVATATAR